MKVCLVGDAAVGKSSLARRFLYDEFSDSYVATLGAKVLSKDILLRAPGAGTVAVRMMVWDIMGETSLLRELGDAYFHGGQGIVAVCDLTRYSTFERLPIWLDAVREVAGDVPMALAVNKVDLKGEALVLYDEYRVRQFANEVGARWYLTSAKTGLNVREMFERLATDIVIGLQAAPAQAAPRFVELSPAQG